MPVTAKIDSFLAKHAVDTPCLVVDLDVVADNYRRIRQALPLADIFYAVKANPADAILRVLAGLGSHYDVASAAEVETVLAAGGLASEMSYGNTVKKEADIARAYGHGVRLFAFDSHEELMKLSRAAPGARVYCRILASSEGAQWPLSRKFGCSLDMARDLLIEAKKVGLKPYGLSFHVGSQQTDTQRWDISIAESAMIFTDLARRGIDLEMLNLGGGFPARYRDPVPEISAFADAISKAITGNFGNSLPRLLIEPGRAICAEAGVLQASVVLVSRKGYDDAERWVYLDVGKFGGLAETMDEAIRYSIETPHDGGVAGPVMLAGPTCDGADTLYENSDYRLPLSLRAGDKVRILAAGAYTTTYAAAAFNGFPPPAEYYI